MAIHKPNDFHFVTLDGNTLTSGGTLSLAKGQVGVFDTKQQTIKGSAAVSSFDKRGIYTIKIGKAPVATTRSAQTPKPWSSVPFKVGDIRDVYVSTPKVGKQKFDILLIGYDGVNADTAMDFSQGDSVILDLILSGPSIGELGYKESKVITKHYIDVAPDDTRTNQEIVEDLVERMKEYKLMGGVPITNYVDITTIDSTKTTSAGSGYTFSTLTVVDGGGSNGLAAVQAQYPDYIVKRTGFSGLTSTYTILAPTADNIADFQPKAAQYVKGCEDCLSGYSELSSGVVYGVNLVDDGADVSTTVDDLPGFVTGTAQKIGGEFGVGRYLVVVDDELTSAEIATFVGNNATAEVILLGDVTAVCDPDVPSAISWVDGDECFASVDSYFIQVPDTDCGTSRLAELQSAYPNLTVSQAVPVGGSATVTLTGTSGTANITINGTNYLATFASDLATTASNFDDTHSAALTALDIDVSDSGAVLTFVNNSDSPLTISAANASGNLAGTVAFVAKGCQSLYTTSVATNVVCDDCDPAFNELFVSEAPQDFEEHSWYIPEVAGDADALMGIKVTGKEFVVDPSEALIDEVQFYETSVRLESAGGYLTEPNASFQEYNSRFNVVMLERAEDRDHLGYNFRVFEDMSRTYFDGSQRHHGNLFAKAVLGEESVLKNRSQYVDYTIVVGKTNYAQEMSGREDTAIAYHIIAEVGLHQDVEDLVNGLAAAAGLDPVQAFPTA